MDTMSAFMMGVINRGKEPKVFDWDKAAQILRERKAQYAEAGLLDDWECTGGTILEDGKPVKNSYTYLASKWATPALELEDGETIECYRMQSEVPIWDAHTRWPKSALAIFNGEKQEVKHEKP